MTTKDLFEMVWSLGMFIIAAGLAITGPKHMHLFDKGFAEKSRRDPQAAAKQVKAIRLLSAVFAAISLLLAARTLLGE
jgi:hypothetical protein